MGARAGPGQSGHHADDGAATPSHLEIPMTRPTGHAASRPFRLTRAAVDAHRDHYPTPFLGCPICARRTAMTPIRIRWISPRQA
jgi:hypothetical protein